VQFKEIWDADRGIKLADLPGIFNHLHGNEFIVSRAVDTVERFVIGSDRPLPPVVVMSEEFRLVRGTVIVSQINEMEIQHRRDIENIEIGPCEELERDMRRRMITIYRQVAHVPLTSPLIEDVEDVLDKIERLFPVAVTVDPVRVCEQLIAQMSETERQVQRVARGPKIPAAPGKRTPITLEDHRPGHRTGAARTLYQSGWR